MTWTGKWGKLNLRQLCHRAGEKGQVRSVGHQSGRVGFVGKRQRDWGRGSETVPVEVVDACAAHWL